MLRPRLPRFAIALLAVPAAAAASEQRPDRAVLEVRGGPGGTVSAAEGRIYCGARCAATFRRGAVVAVRDFPARHFSFEGWTGGCVGTAPRCGHLG